MGLTLNQLHKDSFRVLKSHSNGIIYTCSRHRHGVTQSGLFPEWEGPKMWPGEEGAPWPEEWQSRRRPYGRRVSPVPSTSFEEQIMANVTEMMPMSYRQEWSKLKGASHDMVASLLEIRDYNMSWPPIFIRRMREWRALLAGG